MSAGLRAGTNNDGYLQINGTDVLTALSSGRIGIATTNPSALLDIKVATDAKLLVQDGNTTGNVKFNAVNNAVTGNVNFEIAAQNIQLFAGGSEKLRVTSTGNVGIGTTNPATKLDVTGTIASSSGIRTLEQVRATGWWNNSTGNSYSGLATEIGVSSGEGYVICYNRDASSYAPISIASGSTTIRLPNAGSTIGVTGSIDLSGNLIIGTTGNGINFSAATNAAGMTSELLNDYEEGTFTPTILGNPSYAGNGQIGRYTKVGNLVSFQIFIGVVTAPSSANLEVSSLPFTSVSTTGQYYAYQGWTNSWASGANSVQWILNPTSSTLTAYTIPASGAVAIVNTNSLGSNGNFIITGHYYTSS